MIQNTLNSDSIADLLRPYVVLPVDPCVVPPNDAADWPRIYAQLEVYLELILKWNARMNLTSIRKPEEIVRRHFGESLFLGARISVCGSLLDLGSGAGFPGVPVQLMRPDVRVTLAESQGKKSAFLCEVVRALGLPTEVWAARVETMPADRQFDVVALRAVDNMGSAVHEAAARARERVLILGSASLSQHEAIAEGFTVDDPIHLPGLDADVLLVAHRR